MQIHAAGKVSFSLDATPILTAEAVWICQNHHQLAPEAFRHAVEAWAGAAGAPLRVPMTDGTPQELDAVRVESIHFAYQDTDHAEVTFKAREIPLEPLRTGTLAAVYSADGEERRSARFRVRDAAHALLPRLGDHVAWAGEEFVCENLRTEESGAHFEFEITCRKITCRVVNGPTVRIDAATGDSSQTIVYFVAAAEYPAFLAAHPIDAPAPWAGDGYVIRRVESAASGKLGFLVTLEARQVVTRMLDSRRSERFAGFDLFNGARREVVYQSRWRVRAEDLPAFENITGSNAHWAGNNSIVTDVTPKRLSELEYELDIEAQSLGNPELFRRYSGDDRSNLQGRSDVSARLIDFLVTPEMAGYLRVEGGYLPDEGWVPETDCPFLVAALPVSMADAIVKTIYLIETTYRQGGMSRNLRHLVDWGNSGRVSNSAVGGCSGSFLKITLDSAEISDNCGTRWTRFVAGYQMAPPGYSWNPAYWAKK